MRKNFNENECNSAIRNVIKKLPSPKVNGVYSGCSEYWIQIIHDGHLKLYGEDKLYYQATPATGKNDITKPFTPMPDEYINGTDLQSFYDHRNHVYMVVYVEWLIDGWNISEF